MSGCIHLCILVLPSWHVSQLTESPELSKASGQRRHRRALGLVSDANRGNLYLNIGKNIVSLYPYQVLNTYNIDR